MYFLAQLIVARADYAVYLFFFMQFISLGIFFAFLVRDDQAPSSSLIETALSPALLILVSTLTGMTIADTSDINAAILVFNPLVASVHHTGAIVATLLSFVLALRYEQKPVKKYLLYWTVLSILTVASDKLYIVTAIVPTLCYFFLLTVRRKFAPKIFGRFLGMGILSILAGHQLWIAIAAHRPAGVGSSLAQLSEIAKAMELFAQDSQVFARPAWWFLSLLICFGLLILISDVYQWWRNIKTERCGSGAALLLMSVLVTPAAAFLKGLYDGLTMFRYLEVLIIFPVFWAWFWLIRRLRAKQVAAVSMVMFVLCLGVAFANGWSYWQRIILGYKTPLIACLEHAARERNVQFGYADYWNTKPLRLFSKPALAVAQLNDKAADEHWISSDSWSHEVKAARDSGKSFFIVMTRLNEGAVRKRFGSSREEIHCETERVLFF